MWSALMIGSEIRFHPMCSTVYLVKWLPPYVHFFSTFCYLYMGCPKKCFCWKIFSPEDFSKYDNTSFIISVHRGKGWRQSSNMTYPPNSDSLQWQNIETLLGTNLFSCILSRWHASDMTGNSRNPSFSSKLSYCFQFHSYLAIFCLWHCPFSSECQSRRRILVLDFFSCPSSWDLLICCIGTIVTVGLSSFPLDSLQKRIKWFIKCRHSLKKQWKLQSEGLVPIKSI